MSRRGLCFQLSLVLFAATGRMAFAEEAGRGRPDRQQLPQPVYRVAQQVADAQPQQQQQQPALGGAPAVAGEHPLVPALQMAHSSAETIRTKVKDYTCLMQKRERIGGTLQEPEIMFLKVRHEPFSAYTYFVAPTRLKGQEAIFVNGRNNNELLGHGVGVRKVIGTVSLKPDGMIAMQNQRYPITEIGMQNLVKRLIEVAERDKQYGECTVEFFKDAKIDQRPCTCIQVLHPTPRRNFLFHKAQVFVDNELNMPVRYAAYDWPARPGVAPPLLEEYTYYKIKINQNLTDADFDTNNPAYGFR